ncbi:putative sugar phosphate transporter domain-containing protein [Helianthus annuus]|nr:putative sugar phosphate transporter domain-containing protein [Helianthus annuus]KAJ0474657.1 putative sugar phosphate transporter domain-containing protein [Helianthus annuus]KAJ0650214.1 putative sugar phosphate transporter domain-containing protein [Helianthus annuus]
MILFLFLNFFNSLISFKFELDDRRVVCKAYEADRSDGVEKIEAAKRVKIGVYFATWWFLNVIFNIYNKKVLNVFPYPWLTSTFHLLLDQPLC